MHSVATPEYDFASAASTCTHPETRLTRRVASNGRVDLVHQCQRCGNAGQVVRRSAVSEDEASAAPEFDRDLVQAWGDRRARLYDEAREQINARMKAEQQAKDTTWRRTYDRYIASAEWAHKRRRVLERDSYQCQACGDRRAVEVHHTTYQHLGREPMFELQSVCRPCHEELHADPDLSRWADDGGR